MKANAKPTNQGNIQESQLRKLFEDELKDIYWAEKALVIELPKMAKKATYEELKEAIDDHQMEPEEHVNRLEQVLELIDVKAQAKKCDAMTVTGLIEEAEG